MYNRYIPQPDGSFRRNRIEDSRPQMKSPCKEDCEPQKTAPPPCPPVTPPCPPPPKEPPCGKQESAPGFLRQLLPRDFDSGDLIVILLLLLMAGDCEEDRSTALLTLVLYLIL